MRRRMMLGLMAAGLVAGCGSRSRSEDVVSSSSPRASSSPSLPPSLSPSSQPSEVAAARDAVASDYAWFSRVEDLRKGFCFVWVKDVRPAQVLKLMGAKELERIGWQQMVGAGDGQRGAIEKYYFGVSRLDDTWSLVLEDNGSLGRADELLRALSDGTTVVCLYRASDGSGRFLFTEDQTVQLDFDPASPARRTGARATALAGEITAAGIRAGGDATAAAFALAERLTGVGLTLEVLQDRTYLFSEVSTGQRKSQ